MAEGNAEMALAATERVDWVDTAKGLCIIFVVMVHAVLGVELAAGQQGWMHHVVSWARPFRMPDFFMISGLFLSLTIDRPWRRYLDRKVVHFAYFYVLWLVIQFAFKAPGMAMEEGAGAAAANFLVSFVQPFGTLWFIYVLPIFFVITRLLKGVPVAIVLLVAAVLEVLPIHTGWLVLDEVCSRFVYFYAGYALAPWIFALADRVRAKPGSALALLAVWAVVNGVLVFTPVPASMLGLVAHEVGQSGGIGGVAELPIVSLVLGFLGACAVISVGTLLVRLALMRWLTWLGAHSIVIYLAFFLPMATTRAVLLKLGIIGDVGTMGLLVTAAGVVGPVILYLLVQWSGFGRWLFERPRWASIEHNRTKAERPIAVAE
jgi:uncharacterized membrane protein YcfT